MWWCARRGGWRGVIIGWRIHRATSPSMSSACLGWKRENCDSECSCIADLLLLGKDCVCVPFRHGAICVQYAHSLIMPVGILGGFGLAAGAVSGGRSSRISKEIKFLFRHRSFIYSRKFPGSCRESVQEFSCSALNCYRYICTQIHVLQICM